ncbi:MAG: hypothetical protein P8R54_29950 [Myxococcota bacterium]|nr:hypothetical protein [Myxococcota bacterium]
MIRSRSYTALIATAVLAGCSSSGTYQGQLEPQLGAALPDDLRIVARAEAGTTDMTCLSFESAMDAAGAFRLDGLCEGITYTLGLTDKGLLIEGNHKIQGASEEIPPTLMRIWPSSAGNGVAMLTDGVLKSISTYTDVKRLELLETQEAVLYPRHKPNGSMLVEDGAHLVLTGQATVERLVFQPLVEETVERSFHDSYTLGPHFYVGLKFSSDTEVERLEATIDAAKVTDVTGGSTVVRYIAHDALPPGHYALMGEGDTRMYTITFGPQPAETVSENTP